MLLLAAACVKEPVEQEPQTKQVPLNISIETKANPDGSSPDRFDVNSVRVLVFKNADTTDVNHDKSLDLMVVNEYYPFGFGVSQTNPDGPFTVTVNPVLELDLDCNDYFVYVVLNETGYTLNTNKILADELGNLANRNEIESLLATPVVYSEGIKEAPYCLMSSWTTVHFGVDKDSPKNVDFKLTTPNTSGHAAMRNMAQITIGSIESVPVGTAASPEPTDTELPKVFVLSVELVNVPKDMTWSDADGRIGTNDRITLPIGKANDSHYYTREWGGYAYRNYDVEMIRIDEPAEARIYRTNKSGVDGWGYNNPYLYQVSTVAPTEPTKPFGFPTLQANNKYKYTIWKNGTNNETKEEKNYDTALSAYLAKLPYDSNLGDRLELSDVQEYLDYLDALNEYNEGPRAAYTSANNAITKVETPSTTVITALDGLFANADDEFWENTKTNTTIDEVSASQSDTKTYCTNHSWSIDLDETYYVPENISGTFNTDSTTCIKVKLALASPAINLKSGYTTDQIPAPSGELTGGNSSYWLTNSFMKKNGNNWNTPDEEEFDITTTTTDTKMHVNHYNNQGKIDGYTKRDGGKEENFNGDLLRYSLDYFFGEYGHIVNPSTGDEYDQGLTGNNRPEDNNFNVYIDFENFYRKVDGLTGVSVVTQSAPCADFAWNIPASDSTTGVKEFLIPVNNNIDGNGFSIVRNTKYTVNLTVTKNTYNATAATSSVSEPDFGFGISATVTTEKLTENED